MTMRPETNNVNDPVILVEEFYGRSRKDIWYPRISSCITITLATANYCFGGVHTTIATPKADLIDALKKVRNFQSELSSQYPYINCYVTGAIDFFTSAHKDMASPKVLTQIIKNATGWTDSVLFYDTAKGKKGTDAEVHIFTESVARQPMSYFRPANNFDANKKFPNKPKSRTMIKFNEFVSYK